MSKKLKTILFITAILLGIYFINLALKDDVHEIKNAMYSLNQPMMNIAHIEFLDNKQAIAFYEMRGFYSLAFLIAIREGREIIEFNK